MQSLKKKPQNFWAEELAAAEQFLRLAARTSE